MKRLFFLSMFFALIAGVAFAEINVSGGVQANITPLFGDNTKANDGKVHASGEIKQIRVEASGQDDNGFFGGYIRIDKSPYWLGPITGGDYNPLEEPDPDNPGKKRPAARLPGDLAAITGNLWWKPIDQFKLLLGGNGKDGFFGADGITRWGFYQVAADVGVASEGWAYGASFFGGFDPLFSAVLTITPIEDLEINIGIPFWEGGSWNEAKDVYNFINAQVAYNISNIGKVALTYAGDTNEGLKDGSKMWVYFGLSAIENLGIDIGLGLQFPGKDKDNPDITYNAPLAVGLGVKYDAGDFGVKARVQGRLGESSKNGSIETKGDTIIDFDVLPYYAVSDTVSAFFSAGLQITAPGDNDYGPAGKPDTVTSWHINPYIAIKSSWWAPNFYAGLRIDSDGVKGSSGDGDASRVNWSIPIGIAVSF